MISLDSFSLWEHVADLLLRSTNTLNTSRQYHEKGNQEKNIKRNGTKKFGISGQLMRNIRRTTIKQIISVVDITPHL